MRLEVLHGPDCPSLPPLLERLAEVTALPVTTRVACTDAEAAAAGMAGSPTLLIDGVDPFTATATVTAGCHAVSTAIPPAGSSRHRLSSSCATRSPRPGGPQRQARF